MSFEQQVLSHYIQKRQGGQYVRQCEAFFGLIIRGGAEAVNDFVFLIETCKKANIAHSQPENWHKLKAETWAKDPRFLNSAPVKTMQTIEAGMKRICEKYKVPVNVSISWGAFVQTFSNQIEIISKANWTFVPEAQSFHYSRAFYMVNTAEENYVYIKNRMKACIGVYNAIVDKKVDLGMYEAGNVEKAKKLTEIIKNAFPDVLGKGTQEFLDGLRNEMLSIKKETPFLVKVASAYPCRVTMYLQSRDLRQNGMNPIMKKHAVKLFHMVVPDMKGKLNLKDNLAKAMQLYYAQYALIRFCCATMRRILSGDTRQSGPKKDYSAWALDFDEEDVATDWDNDTAASKKFGKLFSQPNDNNSPEAQEMIEAIKQNFAKRGLTLDTSKTVVTTGRKQENYPKSGNIVAP